MTICYHELEADKAHLHRGDTGGGARVCCKSRERRFLALGIWLAYTLQNQYLYSYRCFDIVERRTGRKVGLALEGLGDGDHLGAVDQRMVALTKERELGHRGLEGMAHVMLVINITLPEASSPRIYHQCK